MRKKWIIVIFFITFMDLSKGNNVIHNTTIEFIERFNIKYIMVLQAQHVLEWLFSFYQQYIHIIMHGGHT